LPALRDHGIIRPVRILSFINPTSLSVNAGHDGKEKFKMHAIPRHDAGRRGTP
jgi:hypothetical protein